jgi:hypothetical protein
VASRISMASIWKNDLPYKHASRISMASIWKNDLPYKHANHSALKPSMMFTAANSRSHSLSSSVGISKVWSQNTRTCVDACACMYARAYMCMHTHRYSRPHTHTWKGGSGKTGNLSVGELWCSPPAQDSDDEQRLHSVRADPDHTRGNVYVCVCGAGASTCVYK